MRILTVLVAAMAVFLSGCSKNNAGNPYYFTFESGSISYSSTVVDSFMHIQVATYTSAGSISMFTYRTVQQTDSAKAGLRTLAAWTFYLVNSDQPFNAFAGTYTTDTSAANHKLLEVGSDFRFYTSYDPHQGPYYLSPGLSFTMTITQFTSTWFEGTFQGRVIQTNGTTNVSDTATITNGKFKLPISL